MNIKFARLFVIVVAITSCLGTSVAMSTEVTVAGFAFAGNLEGAAKRFPYSFKVYKALNAPGSKKNLSFAITERAKIVRNPAIELRTLGEGVNLKSDQALMVVMMLSGETVSTEKVGAYYKTFVNLRGDALIYDYKSQNVVRSYPLSVVVFDGSEAKPSEDTIRGFVEDLLLRQDNKGLVSQFAKRMETAVLPGPGSRTVQVHRAEVAPEALAMMPETLRSDPKVVESILADSFGAILSAKMGVPMLPNSIGHAFGGVMSLRLENGDDIKLKVGEGDYLFDLKLTKFAKIKTAENNVSTSYIYGAYGNVHFYEPTQNTEYINTDLKNGETAMVPAGHMSADDFPAYQDAIRGMFLKFADALNQPGSKWITTAASAKDILGQIDTARDIIGKCK